MPDDREYLPVTAEGIAEWMEYYLLEEGNPRLPQRFAVRIIRDHFGEDFLKPATTPGDRRRHIVPPVLDAFLVLTEDTVVWSRHGLYWRARQESSSGTEPAVVRENVSRDLLAVPRAGVARQSPRCPATPNAQPAGFGYAETLITFTVLVTISVPFTYCLLAWEGWGLALSVIWYSLITH